MACEHLRFIKSKSWVSKAGRDSKHSAKSVEMSLTSLNLWVNIRVIYRRNNSTSIQYDVKSREYKYGTRVIKISNIIYKKETEGLA